MSRPAGRTVAAAAVLLALAAASLTVSAQRRRGGAIAIAQEADFDGGFQFCRVAFRQSPDGDGGGWSVDYPQADRNVTVRLSELTRAAVRLHQGEPDHLVTRLTDDALFRCPFVMMTEPGGLTLDDAEVAALRDYLLKGGFLWADDFWGEIAWQNFEQEMRKVLPAAEFDLRDLDSDHPLFRMQFPVAAVKQIPSINFWAGTGGDTSEWGIDSREPRARAFIDKQGRVVMLATHNTDYGDSWEREGDDPDYFQTFSIDGYAFGINVVLYAMSH